MKRLQVNNLQTKFKQITSTLTQVFEQTLFLSILSNGDLDLTRPKIKSKALLAHKPPTSHHFSKIPSSYFK